jgi:CubicO group peptidase (beta-lactamase class C family)
MKLFSTLLITLVCLQNCMAQKATIPSFVTDSMDSYMQKALTDWNIPGIAIAIIKDGKVILSKGYGVKDIDTKAAVDENTLFMIGSNSKAFTATAIAMLDADKKLSLDDKVTKWIPEFKLDNKAAGEQTIIRDLLCHRLGFKTFQGDFTYWTSNLTRKEVIEKMGHIKAMHPFRTKWGYCNAAFLTAGEIIPKVSGLQWEEYITKNIFTPIGMTNTLALSKDLPNAANKTTAYTQELDGKLVKIPYCLIDNLAAAGSISSSAADMIKWVGTLLNGGKVGDAKVIAPTAIRETWYPHSIIGNANAGLGAKRNFTLYGLGFELDDYEGRKMVSHDGGVNGYVSSVTMFPSEKLGFVVLTNTDQNAFFQAMRYQLADVFLGLPYKNYSTLFHDYITNSNKSELANQNKMKDSAALQLPTTMPLQNYMGNYTNDVYGDMKVVMVNKELRMQFSHHPNMYAVLQPLGGNRFYVTFSDAAFGKAVFPFTVTNGKVKSVTVKVADFVEMTPYEFERK